MSTVEDVVRAYEAIGKAELHYREVLRSALAVRGAQRQIADALGVTREKLRQDALTDEEREAVRVADAQRKTDLRERAKGSAPTAAQK